MNDNRKQRPEFSLLTLYVASMAEDDAGKADMQQSWSALHNKSGFISCFFVLCSATLPSHYTLKKSPLRWKLKPKGSKVQRYLELLSADVIALCFSAFVPLIEYMRSKRPFSDTYNIHFHFLITFSECSENVGLAFYGFFRKKIVKHSRIWHGVFQVSTHSARHM